MSLLTAESAKDFTDARRHAFIEEWLTFFTGRPNDLLSFQELRENLRLQDSAYKGLREIELDKIVGSVGRYNDFTRTFYPKSDHMESRWRQVDAAVTDIGLPPIDVYQVGDVYFVRDGNHRVSIARLHKTKTIEAYVIEYKTPIPIGKDDDLDSILLKLEHAQFFEQTHLDEIRPKQDISFTEPGRYRLLQEHIAFHKYLRETELGQPIALEDAVASWFDTVYLPIIEQIRESNVLKDFPDRTEADLYAWLLLHRAAFEKEIKALGYVPTENLIETVKRERATNPFARLMGFFRDRLDLNSLSLKVEQDNFLKDTQLDDLRPNHNIKFTEPGCYALAKRHIEVHKYLKEAKLDQPISYGDAAASWYDHVYTPLIFQIRDRGLALEFPKNTESDLYLWLVSRREELEQNLHQMGNIPDEQIIKQLEEKIPSNPLERFVQHLNSVSVFDL